jgi:hypothetical protein
MGTTIAGCFGCVLFCLFIASAVMVGVSIGDVEVHTVALLKGKYSKEIEPTNIYRPGK